jgi:hypothetical protein
MIYVAFSPSWVLVAVAEPYTSRAIGQLWPNSARSISFCMLVAQTQVHGWSSNMLSAAWHWCLSQLNLHARCVSCSFIILRVARN